MKGTIGSVSHGTMLERDLIPTFADLLDELDSDGEHYRLILDARHIDPDDYEEREDLGLVEEISGVLEDLFNALEEYAPDFCYFGSHEGDGSDYGFWPCWEQIDEEAENGNLIKVEDLADIPDGHTGQVLVINDHGNATLYNPVTEWKEVWSVV